MEFFEQRYRWYLDLLRDEPALGQADLEAVERQLVRLNHNFEHANLPAEHQLELLKLRNEALAALVAAQHHARIDDARAAGRAVTTQSRHTGHDGGPGRSRDR